MDDTPLAAEHDRAHQAWRNAERIKRLSDDLIRIGPWGLGLDGVLAWVPGANVVYSLGAGGLLLFEGVQAKAKPYTLARMAAYVALNSALDGVPVIGWAADTLFRGHAMAARALQKDIEQRHGAPAEPVKGFSFGFRRSRKPAAGVVDLPEGSWRGI
jgi:hypothetical protein